MAREDDDYDDYEDDRPRRRRRRRVEQPSIGDDAGMRMLLPVGRSIWAIIAGYLGLISVLCLPAPFAFIIGIVAVIDIKSHPEKHGMGRAIFGIVMGMLGSFTLLCGAIALIVEHNKR